MPTFNDSHIKDLLLQREAALRRRPFVGGNERRYIIQETSPVLEGIHNAKVPRVAKGVKGLKHRWLMPTKRWLGKPRNRVGLVGGLMAAGFLKKLYDDSTPEEVVGVNQEDYDPYNPYMSALYDRPHVLQKQSASTTYAFTPLQPPTPKPVGMPSVSRPGPGAGISADKDVSSKTKGLLAGTSVPKLAFSDEGALPLLGGAVGGVGGYMLGDKVIKPLLSRKEKSILDRIAMGDRAVAGIRKAKKIAPLGAAAIGAILLAALAARKARKKGEEDMARYLAMTGGNANAYQYGVTPHDMVDPMSGYY